MRTKISNSYSQSKNNNSFFSKNKSSAFFGVQPKLNIGEPGDRYEKEADRVADTVVSRQAVNPSFFAPSNPFAIQTKPLVESITPFVQKQEEKEMMQMQPLEEEEEAVQPKIEVQRQEEEEEKMMQMQPLEEEEEPIQAKAEEEEEFLQPKKDKSAVGSQQTIEHSIKSTRGNGSNMEASTRAQMENAFGADFSGVKIHTNSTSVLMNKELGAQAFTSGNDIYFNEGKYNPESPKGKKLLAHELTHTVQQGVTKATQGESNVVQKENGTVETSEGIEEIEGMEVASSAEDIRLRLLTEQPVINETINRWVRENFNFIATSMRVAAESFENWYGAHSSSNDTTFVFDVISGGLGILAAAYPPAGIAAAVLGAVVNVTKTARDSQNAANNIEQGTAATVVEQSMINKSEELRNSSIGFAERLKARNENVWNNAGIGITMHDRGVEVFAKQEFYREVGITPVSTDLTRRVLTDMIHAYTNWERGNSLRSSILFVSSRDLEWAFQSEDQRRRRAALRAREQLEVGNSQ